MADKTGPKPRKGKLKVFRTAIGFHDAYVAATSRKAALKAWDTDKDLFARGVAEEVMDPALMPEALVSPGKVFRQLRSMPDDEAGATPRKGAARKPAKSKAPKQPTRPLPPSPPPPRPSREQVDEAQAALEEATARQEREQQDLANRERELADERRAIETRHAREMTLLEGGLESTRQDYDTLLTRWAKALKDRDD